VSYERDGSSYGPSEPDTSDLHIEILHPQQEDQDNQTQFRWYWDGSQNGMQAYCGQWRTTREQAYNEGVQWLRTGLR
jgi:hypothetical protein